MSRPHLKIFNAASSPASKKEIATPICFRVTPSERTRIKELAGRYRVSDYLRKAALDGAVKPRRTARFPRLDDKKYARLLGALGQSRLSSNMNQIAKASNMGALPVTDELIAELSKACADILAMRHDLISALGIKVED